MDILSVESTSRNQMIDVTAQVDDVVGESKVRNGVCVVFVPHTTAGVTINENADPDVTRDMLKELNKMVPFEDDYAHAEGNSAAHVKSTLVGCSAMIPVEEGRLALGTWQAIYFCEFDGPRSRQLQIQILGA